jgi:hypothetical protein
MRVTSMRTNGLLRATALGGAAALAAATIVALAPRAGVAGGSDAGIATPVPDPILTSNELLGEAKADECFIDVGVDYPPINPDGTCPEGIPKTNESYIWGLTQESNNLWYGTMANAACLVAGGQSLGIAGGVDAGEPPPRVCEYELSEWNRDFPAIPDKAGDWRPPHIYQYDLAAGVLIDRDPPDPLLFRTLGFRGAGSVDNIAFLAGANLFNSNSNFFAYRADTGEYLGSCEMPGYDYVRKWETANGVLYVGVGSQGKGMVLRWVGDMTSFDGNFCEDFVEVGHLGANAANVVIYRGGDGQDRLAATTVPTRTAGGVGVWVSPPLGPDGLQPEDADGWFQVWSPLDYDPDRVVATFGYSGGALNDFNGWLYWGTIHLQNSAAIRQHKICTFPFCFGMPANEVEEQALRDGVYRTASVWRGRNLEDPETREIQLLYGESELPACCSEPKTFEMRPTGWTPLYGPSGFGNPSNEYIWQMSVLDGRLYVGTYDASIGHQDPVEAGADLWRFDSHEAPAVNENFKGLGDRLNYGIRSMIPLDDDSGLIVGMANPFNLKPGGGWELRRLKEPPPAQ